MIASIRKKKILISTVLLFLGTVLLAPSTTLVHGQSTGVVCIIPEGSSTCPSSPDTVTGSVGSQLRVSIFVQGSLPMNGWEIILLANHTVINPAGADLTGSVLPFASVVTECLGGRAVRGACNPAATNNLDTLDFAVGGSAFTNNPTTGLLFTAIYNVTSASSGTPLGFQTGCQGSSVSGTTTCVVITSGGPVQDPETVQTAVFSTTSDFTISASPTSLSLRRSSGSTSSITLSSVSGFTGSVALSSTIFPASSKSPSTVLSPSSVTLTSGGTNSSMMAVSTLKNTAFGSYSVTITGTSGTIRHSVTLTVTVTH